ncbi:MAG: TetR family transcriptional regulator [Planctomycetota bacterium]
MPIAAPRRDQHREKTRRALIAAATALFRAHGYEKTTVDQIATAAAVSRRTFFRYFPTKDAVVFPHADERLAHFKALLEPRVGETPLEAVRRACIATGRSFAADRDELVRQQRLIESHPILQAHERDLDRIWEEAIATALQRPGAEGTEGAAPHRAEVMAGAIMGAFRAVLRAWHRSGGKADLEALGASALDLIGTLEIDEQDMQGKR